MKKLRESNPLTGVMTVAALLGAAAGAESGRQAHKELSIHHDHIEQIENELEGMDLEARAVDHDLGELEMDVLGLQAEIEVCRQLLLPQLEEELPGGVEIRSYVDPRMIY